MENEVRITEWIQQTKRYLDAWMTNHPDSSDVVSNPGRKMHKFLDKLFGIDTLANVKVLRPGAGVVVNDKVLFMVGDFKRRNAGTATMTEWEQRGISIVRSFAGKVSSMYFTTPEHTLPGLRLNYWQVHEVGNLWDPIHMAHYRDYDRRNSGFWLGRIVYGNVVGKSIYLLRGKDGKRSFVVDGKPYTEAEAGCTSCGEEIIPPSEFAVLGTKAAISSRPAIAGGASANGKNGNAPASKKKSCKPCQTGKAKKSNKGSGKGK